MPSKNARQSKTQRLADHEPTSDDKATEGSQSSPPEMQHAIQSAAFETQIPQRPTPGAEGMKILPIAFPNGQ